MVDIKQFKHQNQEIQLDMVNEIPKIKCKIHQNSQIELLNINTNSKNLLVCNKCVVFDNLDINQLIFIDEVFSKNKSQIIKNWPPLQNEEIYSLLNSKSVQESQTNRLILQINSYFDRFKQDVINEINVHQKKIVAHINRIEEDRQNIIRIYNEISQKEEIRKQIFENQNNQNYLEDQLRRTILEVQKQILQVQQRIKDCVDNHQKSQDKLKLNEFVNHFENILKPNPIKQIQIKSQSFVTKSSFHFQIKELSETNEFDQQTLHKKEKDEQTSIDSQQNYIYIQIQIKNLFQKNLIDIVVIDHQK